jgi:hypothetical protein
MNRRNFLSTTLGTFATFLADVRAFAGPDARTRLAKAKSLADGIRTGTLDPLAWQDAIESLLRGIDVVAVANGLDLTSLEKQAPPARRGASVIDVPGQTGLKLFFFEPGRANPPHVHANMVSIHLVLSGRFRVRHFDRVRDEPEHFLVRPTIDRVLGPGDATSISDFRDNAHWHHALEQGVLLDVLARHLDPKKPKTVTALFDPIRAERAGQFIRAPRIDLDEALERFG